MTTVLCWQCHPSGKLADHSVDAEVWDIAIGAESHRFDTQPCEIGHRVAYKSSPLRRLFETMLPMRGNGPLYLLHTDYRILAAYHFLKVLDFRIFKKNFFCSILLLFNTIKNYIYFPCFDENI